EYLRCKGTHSAGGGAFGELIQERDVPRITRPVIQDIKAELPRLPECHGRRSRLREHEIRGGDGHGRRHAFLTRQGFEESAVDKSSELPIGRVEKLFPRRVRRRVVEYYCDVDDELLPGRDDGKAAESEYTADVGKRMRNRGAGGTVAIEPIGSVAHIGHIRPGCVEVVRDRDVVQVVHRPAVI